MHINNRYKFKIIHICSSNANEKLLGFKFSLPWPSKCQTVSFHIKTTTTFKSILSFFSKCESGQYLQRIKKRNSLSHKSKIKVYVKFQSYVTMATKYRTIGNLTLKTLFSKEFVYFKQTNILIIHTNDNDN